MNYEAIQSLTMFGATIGTPFIIEGFHRRYLKKHAKPTYRKGI